MRPEREAIYANNPNAEYWRQRALGAEKKLDQQLLKQIAQNQEVCDHFEKTIGILQSIGC